MKVGVLEWDISAMGGRHRTMMAFADWFTELGHDVRFLSGFISPDPSRNWTAKTFLDWFPFQNLQYDQFEWSVMNRSLVPPKTWNDLDVLLCSYGRWGYLAQHLPNTRVITWVILPAQQRLGQHEVWTNSLTSRRRLKNSQWKHSPITIVRPPHDYSAWRRAALPWEKRDIDVLVCGSLLHAKGLVESVKVARACGLSIQILGTAWAAASTENKEVLTALNRLGATPRLNMPYQFVSKTMGRSKVYLSMSQAESCSLAVYEALNAGCRVVSRNVGAVQEQAQEHGLYFDHEEEAIPLLHQAVSHQHDPEKAIARGRLFDRVEIGAESKRALEEAP